MGYIGWVLEDNWLEEVQMETLAKAGIFRDLGGLAQDKLTSEQAHRLCPGQCS